MVFNFTASIDTQKIQFTLKLLFISSKDAHERRDTSLKSRNITVISGSNTNNPYAKIFFAYLFII